jgi:hypothetical protein
MISLKKNPAEQMVNLSDVEDAEKYSNLMVSRADINFYDEIYKSRDKENPSINDMNSSMHNNNVHNLNVICRKGTNSGGRWRRSTCCAQVAIVSRSICAFGVSWYKLFDVARQRI